MTTTDEAISACFAAGLMIVELASPRAPLGYVVLVSKRRPRHIIPGVGDTVAEAITDATARYARFELTGDDEWTTAGNDRHWTEPTSMPTIPEVSE